MTLEEATAYYDMLNAAINSNLTHYFKNNDRIHNCEIARTMLNRSEGDVKMFCGEMSVFRNGFYSYIDLDPANQEPENNERPLGRALRNQLADAIINFVNHGDRRLMIVVEHFNKSHLNDLISPEAIDLGRTNGAIEIKALRDDTVMKQNLGHFSFCAAPNMVRLEQDKVTHTAICAVNRPDDTGTFDSMFTSLWNLAEPIG